VKPHQEEDQHQRDRRQEGARRDQRPRGLATFSGETILYVEDHEDVRRFGISALEGLGYRVLHAADARAALRLLDQSAPQLLFTDVMLPAGMSGLELAEAVSRRQPSLPVLFTGGHVQSLALPDGPSVPPERMLAKPYTVERLAASVRETIDRSAVTGPAPRRRMRRLACCTTGAEGHSADAAARPRAWQSELVAAGSDRHHRDLDHVLIGSRGGNPTDLEGMVPRESRHWNHRTPIGAKDALAANGALQQELQPQRLVDAGEQIGGVLVRSRPPAQAAFVDVRVEWMLRPPPVVDAGTRDR
jgi:CheY-like chemotaxis protein